MKRELLTCAGCVYDTKHGDLCAHPAKLTAKDFWDWPVERCHTTKVATCRVCACTDADCRACIEKTGEPCHWVEPDLCSACAGR